MNMDELTTIKHLSYSQLKEYLMCSLKYKFHYIDCIPPEFIPSALPLGNAVHEAVAAYYQALLENNPLYQTEIEAVFENKWENAHTTEVPVIYKAKDDYYSLLHKGKELVKTFYQAVQNKNKTIIGVEEPFVLSVDPEIPVLVGRIDLLEQDGEGTLCLCDLKTAAKKPTENTYDKDLQMTIYSMASGEFGFDEKDILTRVDVLVKTQEPQFLSYYTTCSERDRLRAKKLIKEIWNGISKEVFFPNPSYLCSDCSYHDLCREWA